MAERRGHDRSVQFEHAFDRLLAVKLEQVYGIKIERWRIVDLCRSVEERWGVSYSETGMLRVLWSLDLSHRKTRPRHPQSSEKSQQALKSGVLSA